MSSTDSTASSSGLVGEVRDPGGTAPVQREDSLSDPLLQHTLTDPLTAPPDVQFTPAPPPDDAPIQMRGGGTPVENGTEVEGDFIVKEKTGLYDLANRKGRVRGAKDRLDKKEVMKRGDILETAAAGEFDHVGRRFYKPMNRRITGTPGAVDTQKVEPLSEQILPHKKDHAFVNDTWFMVMRDTQLREPVAGSVEPGDKMGKVRRNTKIQVDTHHKARSGGTQYYGMVHETGNALVEVANLAELADGQLTPDQEKKKKVSPTRDYAGEAEEAETRHSRRSSRRRARRQGDFKPGVIRSGGKYYEVEYDEEYSHCEAGTASVGDLVQVNYNILQDISDQKHVAIKVLDEEGEFSSDTFYIEECKVGPMGEGMGTLGEDEEDTKGKWAKFIENGGEAFGLTGNVSGGMSSLKLGVTREKTKEVDEHGNLVSKEEVPKKGSTLESYLHTSRGTDAFGGSVGMGKGIFGFAAGIQKFAKGGKLNRLEAVLDMMESGSSTVSSFTWMVHKGIEHESGGETNDQWEHTALVTNAITSSISAVKSAVLTLISAIKLGKDRKKSTQKGRRGAKISAMLFSAVQSGLSTARAFLWALDKAIPASLASSIPGMGIVVNAANAAIAFGTAFMASKQKESMTEAEGEDMNDLATRFGTKLDDMTVDDKRGVFGKRKVYKRFSPLLLAKLEEHDWSQGVCEVAVSTNKTVLVSESDYQAIRRYEFSSKMREINQKRQVKGNIKGGTALISMAGDIASLSGVGAIVGGAIKAALLAGTLIYKGGRLIQQRKRNSSGEKTRQAINTAKNGSTTLRDFKKNKPKTDKSTSTKKKQYRKHARFIFEMVANLPGARQMATAEEGEQRLAIKKKYDDAEKYIGSTGVDKGLFYSENGRPESQYKMLVSAIESR